MRHIGDCCAAEAGLESIYTGPGARLYNQLSALDTCGLETLLDVLRDAGAHRVVDLGAGSGRIALALLEAGLDVTAVDLSTDLLRLLEVAAADRDPHGRLDTVHADMLRPLVGVQPADAVVIGTSNLTMFDAEARARCLDAARGVLRPGGVLVVEIYQIDPGTEPIGPVALGPGATFTEVLDEAAGRRRVTITVGPDDFVSTTHLLDAQGVAREIEAALGAPRGVDVQCRTLAEGRHTVHLVARAPAGVEEDLDGVLPADLVPPIRPIVSTLGASR